jgi:valyl-tRNA synthetase
MRGKAVFYPVGWDDNGLPTERRVQNYFGVRCDPSLPYDPGFTPPEKPTGQVPISRRNFVELCQQLTELDEQAFEEVWRRLGLSVDWSTKYRTIGDDARAISQRAFTRNLARGEAYLAEGPTLWDVTFRTAVAQADLEDREVRGAWYRIGFGLAGQAGRPHGPGQVAVATTRPSCCRPASLSSCTRPTSGMPRWWDRQCGRRCSAPRCRCSRTGSPSRARAPASSWCARSATRPTSPGGGTCSCPPAR